MSNQKFTKGRDIYTGRLIDLGDGSFAESVSTPAIQYLGGETLTPNNASTACTIPTGTNLFAMAAEGGAIYYVINPGAAAASAASPGFVPAENRAGEGPLDSLTSLKVFAPAGSAKAHISYYKA
jgi:hypothetical protein